MCYMFYVFVACIVCVMYAMDGVINVIYSIFDLVYSISTVKHNQHKLSHVKFTKPGHIADILQIELAASGISELREKESPRKETNQAYDPLCDILVKYLGNYLRKKLLSKKKIKQMFSCSVL